MNENQFNATREVNKIVVEHRELEKIQDSIEIGTPSKGGAIKCYMDFNDVEGSKIKIERAVKLKEYFNEQLGVN